MVSERDDVVSLSEVNYGPQLPHTLPLLLNQTKQRIYKQRGIIKGDSQYLQKKWGTQFPWTKH